MSKTCLLCGETFPDAATFCPRDGSALRATVVGDDLIGELFCERYVATDLLGEGGMAAVYLARDVRLPQQVAIKVLRDTGTSDPSVVRRFRHEAEAASRINHDRVARVTDFGFMTDGRAFLVMEYVNGRTLRELLDARGTLSFSETAAIIYMVAEGLHAAHRLGIVHRDLKPENIMVVEEDDGSLRVKVLDFGIAKLLEDAEGEGRTAPGFAIGTPKWMSPEQLLGQALDARSDVYSLGLLAFTMLTGARAFSGSSEQEEMLARLSAPPRALLDVRPDIAWPAPLQALFARTLVREPAVRPESAVAFARELRRIIDGPSATVAFTPPSLASALLLQPAAADSTPTPTPIPTPTPMPVATPTPTESSGESRTDATTDTSTPMPTPFVSATNSDTTLAGLSAGSRASVRNESADLLADDRAPIVAEVAGPPLRSNLLDDADRQLGSDRPLSATGVHTAERAMSTAPVSSSSAPPVTVELALARRARRVPLFTLVGAIAAILTIAVFLAKRERPSRSTATGAATPATPATPVSSPVSRAPATSSVPSTAVVPSTVEVPVDRDSTAPRVSAPTSRSSSTEGTRRAESAAHAAAISRKRAPVDTATRAPVPSRRATVESATTPAPQQLSADAEASIALTTVISDTQSDLASRSEATRKRGATTLVRELQALMPRLRSPVERGWASLYLGTSFAILGDRTKACALLAEANAGAATPATLQENGESLRKKLRCTR